MEEKFYDKLLYLLKKAVDQYGSASALSRASGVSVANISRWINNKQAPRLTDLAPIMDLLGVLPKEPNEDSGKDVCFVNAKLVPAAEDTYEPPQAEDYLAAPMVGEVGAGPGYIPQEEIKSWFLVYRNLPAVRYRRNLLAVEIGPHSDSMQPTLNPRDIVLVDRDDRDIQHPGHMMLVLDPDGAGMIKRVAVEDLDDGDSRITFYSDNAMKHPPAVYSLERHYCNDWERCIVGRVIWAWADMRQK